MAFAKPSRGQQAAARGAVHANRFCGVIGTTGIKTAILSKKGTDAYFVGAQQKQQDRLHHRGPPCRSG
jgi:hypothetical protein